MKKKSRPKGVENKVGVSEFYFIRFFWIQIVQKFIFHDCWANYYPMRTDRFFNMMVGLATSIHFIFQMLKEQNGQALELRKLKFST